MLTKKKVWETRAKKLGESKLTNYSFSDTLATISGQAEVKGAGFGPSYRAGVTIWVRKPGQAMSGCHRAQGAIVVVKFSAINQ